MTINQRGLVLPVLAAGLLFSSWVGYAEKAAAQEVSVSLNLTYTDPGDTAGGGTWQIVAKTSTSIGIASVHAIVNHLDNNTGDITIATDIGALNPINTGAGPVPPVITNGTISSILYGQDLSNTPSNASQVAGVGTPSFASAIAQDPLHDPQWDDSTILFSGTFGSTRPEYTTSGSSATDGNVYTVFDSIGSTSRSRAANGVLTVVRGDSVAVDGLPAEDVNRDFQVNASDLAALVSNYGMSGDWSDGDLDSSGSVGGDDLALVVAAITPKESAPSTAGASFRSEVRRPTPQEVAAGTPGNGFIHSFFLTSAADVLTIDQGLVA